LPYNLCKGRLEIFELAELYDIVKTEFSKCLWVKLNMNCFF